MIFSTLTLLVSFGFLINAGSIKKNRPVFNTTISVQLPAENAAMFTEIWEITDRLSAQLSVEDANSKISILNRTGASEFAPEVLALFQKAQDFYHASGNTFHFIKRKSPSNEVTQPHWSVSRGVELKLSPGVLQVDLRSLQNGFTADLVANHMRANGLSEARVRVGNSLVCFSVCKTQLRHPFGGDQSWALIELKAGRSVATKYQSLTRPVLRGLASENAEKQSSTNNDIASLTLIGTQKASDIDAWSSVVVKAKKQEQHKVLKQSGLAYLIVYQSGMIEMSDNFFQHVNDVKFSPKSWSTASKL